MISDLVEFETAVIMLLTDDQGSSHLVVIFRFFCDISQDSGGYGSSTKFGRLRAPES